MLANNIDPVAVKHVQWLRVAPVLHLLKALRYGFRLRILVPTALVLVCVLFGPTSRFTPRSDQYRFRADIATTGGRDMLPIPLQSLLQWPLLPADTGGDPLRTLVSWTLLVVSTMIAAVAIARATSQDLCARSRTGALASLRYSCNGILSSLTATALAFFILLCLGLPLMLAQWMFGPETKFRTLSGILSAPTAIYGVLAVFGACVVFIGWLLALAAVGTDGCDGPDALSRGISYTLSEKLLTVVYGCCALAVCGSARLIAILLCRAAYVQLPLMMQQASVPRRSPPLLDGLGRELLGLFPAAVQLGSFLSAVTIIYVLLRRRVDGIDLEETGTTDGTQPAISATTAA